MCSQLKIRGLARGSYFQTDRLAGGRGGERDGKFCPRRASSAKGQKDRGGATARSRLHEKETSGRSGERGKISTERDIFFSASEDKTVALKGLRYFFLNPISQ